MKQNLAFLIDIDGVVRLVDRPVKGAGDALNSLRAKGIPFLLLTNNSTRPPEYVADFLKKLGVAVDASEIFTSALATALYLKSNFGEGRSAYVVGESGLIEAIRSIRWRIVNRWQDAEFVVVGLDTGFNYHKLEQAVRAIVLNNAKFIATNSDRALIHVDGPKPGAGSMVAAIEYAANAKPFVVGKPNPLVGRLALKKLGVPENAQIFVVGDRIETDMLLAKRLGAKGILVLTGATKQSDLESLDQAERPDFVIESIVELPDLIDKIL